MTFPILGILIHDEVNIAMVYIDQSSTLHNVQTIDMVSINVSDSALPGGLGDNPHIRSCKSAVGLVFLVQHDREEDPTLKG